MDDFLKTWGYILQGLVVLALALVIIAGAAYIAHDAGHSSGRREGIAEEKRRHEYKSLTRIYRPSSWHVDEESNHTVTLPNGQKLSMTPELFLEWDRVWADAARRRAPNRCTVCPCPRSVD